MSDGLWAAVDAPALEPGRSLTVPGRGEIVVRDEGPRDGPPVMLLHGWTVTADLNFFAQYPALREHHRVIAFDHAGHGSGLRPRRRVSVRSLALDALAVADALELGRFTPVGYSLGGAVGQVMARERPDRLDGLVLAATLPRFRASELRLWPGVMLALAGLTRLSPTSVVDRVFGRMLAARTGDLHPWGIEQLRRNDPRILLEVGSSLFSFDSRRWLGEVRLPSAVVVTADDVKVRPHNQRRFGELLTDVSFHTVAGAHDAPVTSPDSFTPGLLEALASVHERAGRTSRAD